MYYESAKFFKNQYGSLLYIGYAVNKFCNLRSLISNHYDVLNFIFIKYFYEHAATFDWKVNVKEWHSLLHGQVFHMCHMCGALRCIHVFHMHNRCISYTCITHAFKHMCRIYICIITCVLWVLYTYITCVYDTYILHVYMLHIYYMCIWVTCVIHLKQHRCIIYILHIW